MDPANVGHDSMAVSSNEKRSLLRQQCREALSAHIYSQLGLVVLADRVRLQPSAGDGYAWSVTKANAWLLQSNLSNGTVGLYRSICNELGRSLEAVGPEALQPSRTRQDVASEQQPAEEHKGSFTARIRDLEAANRELGLELELKNTRLQEMLSKNRELQLDNRRLEGELETTASLSGQLEQHIAPLETSIAEAMQVLQKDRPRGRSIPRFREDEGASPDSNLIGMSKNLFLSLQAQPDCGTPISLLLAE